NGRASVFQTEGAGSIPVARSQSPGPGQRGDGRPVAAGPFGNRLKTYGTNGRGGATPRWSVWPPSCPPRCSPTSSGYTSLPACVRVATASSCLRSAASGAGDRVCVGGLGVGCSGHACGLRKVRKTRNAAAASAAAQQQEVPGSAVAGRRGGHRAGRTVTRMRAGGYRVVFPREVGRLGGAGGPGQLRVRAWCGQDVGRRGRRPVAQAGGGRRGGPSDGRG